MMLSLMRIEWHLLLYTEGPWCLFSASLPRCLYWAMSATAPALQGEEVTLPSLPRLGASALLPLCSVAGAGAAPRLLWPPGRVP